MFKKLSRKRVARALGIFVAVALSFICLQATDGVSAASTLVSVFPIPGSQVVSPRAQIAFRGLTASELGAIAVSGARSGPHTGKLEGDSDGRGGSFLPVKPFSPGELVTVRTGLDVRGASHGSFTFRVATSAGAIPYAPLPFAVRVRGDVSRFRSRPGLVPAAVKILGRSGRTAPGDIFIGPQQGPVQKGPMIIDPSGGLVWFKPLPHKDQATDVRVQTYANQPVLTWWQGYLGAGIGVGEDVIDDTSYKQIAVVRAANGLSADLHELKISPQGTALITAYYPVYWNWNGNGRFSRHGAKRRKVFDSVVQEIDIPTGLVLFQWDSLDHVPLNGSYLKAPRSVKSPFDYFHVNAVEPDTDGNLVISARNTWAAYKVDHSTGRIIWVLGGRHSSFKMGPGASFAFQHDVRVRASNDLFITMFDDGAGPPIVHKHSRGLKLILDTKHMTAREVAGFDHAPQLLANYEGNFQQLSGGDKLLGWGQQPYFTEFNSRGKIVFDARFVGPNSSYRAYRFPWNGTPHTAPAIAATSGKEATVYVSWNGATNVASWRVLGGPSATRLRVLSTVRKRGFETSIRVRAQHYVAAQALDSHGHELTSSATVRTH